MNKLREVKVSFGNGDVIHTNMAAGLTDQEIKDYYKIGRIFNLGAVGDNMQKVIKLQIIK